MLKHRLVLGPVLIALLLAGAWLDEWIDRQPSPGAIADLIGRETLPPGVIVFMLTLALAILGGRELARILRHKGVDASTALTSTLAVLGVCLTSLVPSATSSPDGLLLGVMIGNGATALILLGSLAFYARKRQTEGMIAAAGGALLGYVYIGVLLGFLVAIRREHAVWVLIWALLVTKSCDIGAFFTGRAIGKRKLALWISPGKTWEGLFGGMALAAVVGALGVLVLRSVLDDGAWTPGVVEGAIAGAVFAVVGQLGDLVASLLKRDAGVKDAGTALPGFGGVLDVIDSPLAVGLVAYWWMRFSEHGLTIV